MRFFEFRQNNPGGRFDKAWPLTLVVEARDCEHANERAESLGIYFDGVEAGRDCSCCGDRWYRAGGKGSAEPDTRLDEMSAVWLSRVQCGVRVEYVDGREVSHHLPETNR